MRTDSLDPANRDLFFGRELRYLRFAAWAVAILLVVRLIDTLIFDLTLSKRRNLNVPLLLRQIVSFALFLMLLSAAFARIFKTDVTGLAISGTVVAAVLGLALQDTLGNLFSGVSLHMEQTFGVGDVIRSGEFIGVVEGVNWRATRLRTFNNNVVVIPNSLVSREHLEVFARGASNARLVTVHAGYHVPPAEVIAVLRQAASNVENVATDSPVLARVGGFGESGITYEVKYWTREYHLRDSIDAEIRRAIWYAFKRNGISIPYPIRVVKRYSEPKREAEVVPADIADRLAGVDILAPLSRDERQMLAGGARILNYSRGETILSYGQQGDSMFVIHSGTVSVRIPAEGVSSEVAQLGPGSIFGEMALLTGESRAADVIALTDVTAVQIGKATMEPVLHENPDLAAALSQRIAERQSSSTAPDQADAEEHSRSVLGRIRGYFGLTR